MGGSKSKKFTDFRELKDPKIMIQVPKYKKSIKYSIEKDVSGVIELTPEQTTNNSM